MMRALDGYEGGVSIGGKRMNNLRYADDTTILAKDTTELVEMLQRITDESRLLGLEINLDKTKLMIVDRGNTLELQNLPQHIQVVQQFNYLGSLISCQGGFEPEIRRRIALARKAVTDLVKIWSDRQIAKTTKI